jgi:hypothetical protein
LASVGFYLPKAKVASQAPNASPKQPPPTTYQPSQTKQTATQQTIKKKVKEGARGQRWFLEADLRGGSALRPDKSGRALLMLLRHLGRVSEVRRAFVCVCVCVCLCMCVCVCVRARRVCCVVGRAAAAAAFGGGGRNKHAAHNS